MSGPEPTLADAGFVDLAHDPVPLAQAARLVACLDIDPAVLDHGVLPTLWHWALFHPDVPTANLGVDGHPRRRPEMDEFPQRMWVGGRVHVNRPLRIGVDAERVSRVVRADVKEGGAGRFWLVTVGHVIEQDGSTCIDEEQDLVFRTAGALAPVGPDADTAPDCEWVEARVADPKLLFRFSAVTSNAHRIHYDQPYATETEGYPDLVVHGPLTAILLADLARTRRGADAREVSYRARAPHFANRRFWLAGDVTQEGASLRAVRADGEIAMTLDVR
ncbi:MAG TPA: acyl-CoA dehydrogenase [Acidimicrobiia bacterium]|nr:acyl-CoA dehydrogenase [Acidimicrobiia bacterium]